MKQIFLAALCFMAGGMDEAGTGTENPNKGKKEVPEGAKNYGQARSEQAHETNEARKSVQEQDKEAREKIDKNREEAGLGGETTDASTPGDQQTQGPDLDQETE